MPTEEKYMISSGEYSDYTVLAVFEDKDTAAAWATAMCQEYVKGYAIEEPTELDVFSYSSRYRVEKLMFIAAGTPPIQVTTYQANVQLWDDGKVDDLRYWSNTNWLIDCWNEPPTARPKVRYVRAPYHNGRGGRLEAKGSNEEAVRKVMQDRIRMWKAGQYGGPSVPEVIEEEVEVDNA